MKQKNLDELRNIYLGLVTGGEGLELLSEYNVEAEKRTIQRRDQSLGFIGNQSRRLANATIDSFKTDTNATKGQDTFKSAEPIKAVLPVKKNRFEIEKERLKKVGDKPETAAQIDARVAALNAKKEPPASAETQRPAAETQRPAAAPRPAASGPVLSKLKGVEGTGVGANFKAKAFTDTEKTRYSSVAAAKPAIPTGTTAGGTTFQRRTPTSAELGAAQASRAAGGSEESAIKAGVGASKPVAPVGDKFGTTSTIKPPSPTQVKSDTPTTQLTKMQPSSSDNSGETDRLKKALDIKKSDVTSSYQFPMSKTLRDLSDSYNEIYEAKKQVDQDEDGDNDFADNMIARMVASGMSREEAIKKVKNKDYNKKNELDEGIGSAIRGLFGKKKEPEVKKPPSRGAELRAKYNIEPGNTAKQQILAKTRKKAEEDEKEYGDSPYSKSVATNSREAHNTRLRAGYSLHRATGGSGGEGGSGGPGRGSKAAKRAAALNNSYDLYDLIQSHLLEYGFADTEEGANMIIENMSQSWIKQILSED